MITPKPHARFNSPIDDNIDGVQIDHNKLLADLVHCNHPLIDIATTHKLKLAQLIAWIAQPAVRALLDAADEAANRIAAHKAAQGATAAVQTLLGQAVGLCESTREQGLANSGARAILRFTTKPAQARKRPAALKSAAGAPPQATPNSPAPLAPSLRFPVYPFSSEPSSPMNSADSVGPIGPISPGPLVNGHDQSHSPFNRAPAAPP